jgi:hypothetical protein
MKSMRFFSFFAATAVAFSPHLRYALRAISHYPVCSSLSDQQYQGESVLSPNSAVEEAKLYLLDRLQAGEDENSPTLTPFLDILKLAYAFTNLDARTSKNPYYYNGDWGNINTPDFPGCLGFDQDNGFPTYAIGTLTFGMIPDAAKQVV